MGNCLDRQVVPMMVDSTMGQKLDGRRKQEEEEEEELKKAEASTVQVKILITRKQWEELVSHGDLKLLDADKLLSAVIMSVKTSGRNVVREKTKWRPALQRIAEVSE